MDDKKLASSISLDQLPDLMAYRVSDILMVSSLYESFIMERDGLLQDQPLSEHQHHNTRFMPRIRQATTANEALQILAHTKIDLVITGTKLHDLDLFQFVTRIREAHPSLPIVLLTHVTDDLKKLSSIDLESLVNNVFVWTGDSKLLFAIAKWLEDQNNVSYDTQRGDVRVIIVVEDSPRYYSIFLPIIYSEIMRQTTRLLGERLNVADAMARTRARPKILLAKSYEEALSLFNSYRDNILGVISDITFPRQGALDDAAGFTLTQYIKSVNRHIPVILQSADISNAEIAHEKGAHFVSKNSSTMLQDLREFLLEYFGFGDFVFRNSLGEEVARTSTVKELELALQTVPIKSLEWHSQHNDFSHWLFARGEFKLANLIRPVNISDFETSEELRSFLVQSLLEERELHQRASVSDFNIKSFDGSFLFERIGLGSMGGKARGLAFVNYLLANQTIKNKIFDVSITVPKSLVIASDQFDQFLEENKLSSKALLIKDDQTLRKLFSEVCLPKILTKNLRVFLKFISGPLAVRSSSLFEDSQDHPFAGIYNTIMLPNNHVSLEARLFQLCDAIKAVYASTFSQEAKTYIENSSFRLEEEKMSIIIQETVGEQHGQYFYPSFSGVAQSYNFYPISHISPFDGSAHVVLGFGKTVVEGGLALRFCPRHPQIFPQFPTPRDLLKLSQKKFWALDFGAANTSNSRHEHLNKSLSLNDALVELGLNIAEEHGTLAAVGGTYSIENDCVYDGINRPGVRVVNFSNVLKNDLFPLSEILSYILETGAKSFAGPVEIEFAVNLNRNTFYLLQIRPYLAKQGLELVEIRPTPHERILARSSRTLGNRRTRDIRHIVYIIPDRFDPLVTTKIASEIGTLNSVFAKTKTPYLLIGIGRWGTSDPSLGVPVTWSQISFAEVIVEAGLDHFRVEPSSGTHFFHNITAGKAGCYRLIPVT